MFGTTITMNDGLEPEREMVCSCKSSLVLMEE